MRWSTLLAGLVACGEPSGSAIPIVSEGAPVLESWSGAQECCGEDPHPVHLGLTPTGDVVMVGKAASSSGTTQGFATLWTPPTGPAEPRFVDGEKAVIRATRQLAADSAMLQVIALQDAVLAVGFQAESATSAAAAVLWVMDPADLAIRSHLELREENETSAVFESLALDDSGLLVVGGSRGLERSGMEGFKSYGNVFGGRGVVVRLELASVLSAEGVTQMLADQTATARDLDEVHSAKSVRFTPDGGVAVVGHDEAERSGLVRVDPSLAAHSWTRTDPQVELTDLAVVPTTTGSYDIALVGHGGAVGIDGHMIRVTAAGEVVWSSAFGNPGVAAQDQPAEGLAPDAFVFDECWGIARVADGVLVAACGSGIEGCGAEVVGEVTQAERTLCRSDPRLFWRTHLVGLDLDGEVLWSRTDAFVADGEVAASAAEHLVSDDSGHLYVLVDQDFGVGLVRFALAER